MRHSIARYARAYARKMAAAASGDEWRRFALSAPDIISDIASVPGAAIERMLFATDDPFVSLQAMRLISPPFNDAITRFIRDRPDFWRDLTRKCFPHIDRLPLDVAHYIAVGRICAEEVGWRLTFQRLVADVPHFMLHAAPGYFITLNEAYRFIDRRTHELEPPLEEVASIRLERCSRRMRSRGFLYSGAVAGGPPIGTASLRTVSFGNGYSPEALDVGNGLYVLYYDQTPGTSISYGGEYYPRKLTSRVADELYGSYAYLPGMLDLMPLQATRQYAFLVRLFTSAEGSHVTLPGSARVRALLDIAASLIPRARALVVDERFWDRDEPHPTRVTLFAGLPVGQHFIADYFVWDLGADAVREISVVGL